MKNYFEIDGSTLSEKVENAKNESLSFFVRPVNSTEDHYYFFETENEADDFASKFDEEEVEKWDLTDEMSNEALLQD